VASSASSHPRSSRLAMHIPISNDVLLAVA
jgi:hypothetical protein